MCPPTFLPFLPSAARFLLALVLLVTLIPAAGAQEIAFMVSLKQPNTHLLTVTMQIPAALHGESLDLALPVWTPGSYVLREYSTDVTSFDVADNAGKPIRWHKTSKNIWHIDSAGTGDITATYQVYANNPDIHYSEYNSEHAFLHGASYLMHIVGKIELPATLAIIAPPDWKFATGLPTTGTTGHTFRAPNFDTLYDSPIEIGKFTQLDFTALNKPHRIILYGSAKYDADQLKKDVQKIVETEAAMMGGLPYTDYTFILHLRPGGNSGLEHLNSTAIELEPSDFETPLAYRDALNVIAHEYFHLWNVKRIKPDALGPFDYSHENYTRLLWVAEGITSYYADVFMHRAGLTDSTEYLRTVAGVIGFVERTPGRRAMSLEEASFDAWVKQYKPGENSVNSQISYYNKGAAVGLLLDLTIRQRTDGAKSLDDVMRTLYTNFALKNRNYTPDDFQRVCEQVAGGSLEPFFAQSVRGRAELRYDEPLAAFGLRLQRNATTTTDGKSEPIRDTYLGLGLQRGTAGITVTRLVADTPAYTQDIAVGDIIIAVDDLRVTDPSDFNNRVAAKKPGDIIRISRFRGDRLETVAITLGSLLRSDYRLLTVEKPTDAQKKLYKVWLGSDLIVAPAKPQPSAE